MKEQFEKIAIYGNKNEINQIKNLLGTIPNLHGLSEGNARLKIQDIIDRNKIKADILYDGNTVYSKNRIIGNLKKIMKAGVLGYSGYIPIGSMLKMPSMMRGKPILSDYFYNFLYLHCGSIAHYNKMGWIAEYPTIEDLKEFFLKNEFGKRVIEDLPNWYTDAIKIVEEIEELLGIENK